jgi:hypothetical protein
MYGLNQYEMDELQPSMCQQLDVVGMQPHSREYLEYEVNCMRSERKFEMIAGQMIDYTRGIQFSGRP